MRSSSALRLVLASGRRSAARGSAGISRKTPLASGTMRVFRMGGMLSSGLPAASTQMMRSRPWICSNISISRRTQELSCVSGEQMTISVREAANASRMLSGSECEAASSSSSRKHLPSLVGRRTLCSCALNVSLLCVVVPIDAFSVCRIASLCAISAYASASGNAHAVFEVVSAGAFARATSRGSRYSSMARCTSQATSASLGKCR